MGLFSEISLKEMLKVGGIWVPLYLTVKNDDEERANIGISKVENVKNLR